MRESSGGHTEDMMDKKQAHPVTDSEAGEEKLTVFQERTLYQAFQDAEAYLLSCGIEDASVDAWLLMESVTGIRRAMFLAERRSRMNPEQQDRYFSLVKERGTHIPLQHLTGEQEFMGLTFKVNEHVLIPRQDTEILVEEALRCVSRQASEGTIRRSEGPDSVWKVLDLCTGSGCIAVSIAELAESPVSVTASDISEEALKVAAQNVSELHASVRLIHSDLFDQITEKYDMIVSNPPYIRTSVIAELSEEVRSHEPFGALDGKEDGLYFYRRIVEEAPQYLKDGGHLLFEIGYDQGYEVSELLRQRGFTEVRVQKDLAGLDRVVTGVWNEKSCE